MACGNLIDVDYRFVNIPIGNQLCELGLRLNNASNFNNGVLTPGNMRVGNILDIKIFAAIVIIIISTV